MKVLCTKKELHETVASGVRLTGRSPMPILGSFLVRTIEGGLEVTAFDLEVGLRRRIAASVLEPGAVTISAKLFAELVGALPDSSISIESSETGQLKVTCERSSFDLLGLPAEDFPTLPEVGDDQMVTLSAEEFRGAVTQVALAASADEARAVMTGINIVIKSEPGTITLAATDGHRLAVRNIKVEDVSFDASIVVPSRALNELARLLPQDPNSKVTLRVSESQALFECDGATLVSRLIEGQFPNFERVIPASAEKSLTAQTHELAAAVRRASIVAREASNRLVFSTEGEKLIISAESGGVGKAREEVEVLREGDEAEIAFNGKYVLDVLSVIGSEGVRLELGGNLSPALVRPVEGADYLYIIMPMQIV